MLVVYLPGSPKLYVDGAIMKQAGSCNKTCVNNQKASNLANTNFQTPSELMSPRIIFRPNTTPVVQTTPAVLEIAFFKNSYFKTEVSKICSTRSS